MDRGMKVYICGKITGLPLGEAFERFQQAENLFPANEFIVVNPMKLPHNHDKSWESYMKECIHHLLECTHIYCIPDELEESKGAAIEMYLAEKLKIKPCKQQYKKEGKFTQLPLF
jgi:hypothetical protein